ncbi:MAG: hypothetical protein P8J37_14090 [Fuerstiella sp.]|nr:hypothetical protein [Fuerstiella sp.]
MNLTHSRLSQTSISRGVAVLLTVTFGFGCADQDSAITTEMHEDFDHDHKHLHTGDDDHEHEHKDGFKGSHAHGHSHSHRHGEPLYGGRIVSIGHTHHKDGATHFHAEVMPLTDNTVRFHLLTESDDGNSKGYPVDDAEIPALISIKARESSATECSFVAIGDGNTSAEFALEIPESVHEGEAFSVVIPKVKLDGNRQNFSFSISRNKADNDAVAADSALESSDE